uniref:Uncharacterized protein n=1 Tax=Pristionchus pacificus TaxID=54126 RepID=A0A2A6CVL9_PRIPA|eukprot:PDM82168.1 protein kinase [Pristionchus pacificus]
MPKLRKIIDDQEVSMSRTLGRGTAKYMAPEQKDSWAGYSAKVDIFSLGLILAELWVPMTDDQAATFRTNRDIRLLGIGLYVGEGKSRANGTASDYGINGKHNVTAGGVAFDFRNSSLPDENYTTADMGQIPELYFLKAEEYEEKIKDNVYGRVAARQAQIDKKVQEYKGEIANREDQIHTMQTEIDKLKSALDMALEKLARIELTNSDQIKTTSDTNTKVEKALADFKQSSEMKYQEQEARINDLENKSTEAAMNRNNVTGFRLRFLFDMNGGSVVNRFRETAPEQWSFELAVIFDYWASACMPVKPGAKQMANGNRWMLEKDERIGDEFKTDRDIRLEGIGVYIGEGERFLSAILLKILGDNEDTAEEFFCSNEVNIDYSDYLSCRITRISFTNPCLIPANEWHVITVWRGVGPYRFGSDGKDRVEADGVVFDFRRSKFSVETDVKLEYGQIPEIYFKLQIELGDIKLKYQQQQAEVEELKEKLIQAWLAQFPHLIFDSTLQTVKTTLKFNDLEKLDKLLVTIQLENGNNIYYDNVKPFELFAMIDGKRENADLKLLEGEYDCSFKGVMGNYAYFSSARKKIVRFFKVSIADSKIQLELINELKTTDLIPFENQPLYFIEESREWIVFHYHENYTKMEGEKFDISELRSIRKFDCHYHRGILYFFRENTTPKLERLNEKVVVVETPVFDGQLSYYTPPHSDYIYVANTDQNILITLNTTNLHVAQHSYEPPIDSTYHSIVGVHNGILTMVFEGIVGRLFSRVMTVAIEMEPLLSLSNLPSDIIRVLIATEAGSISRSWYFLLTSISPPALERVYLCSGTTSGARSQKKVNHEVTDAQQFLHMRAIFPKSFVRRAGVGKWLRIVNKYDKDAVKFACGPSRFDCENEFYGVGIFMCALSIWTVGLVCALIFGIAGGLPGYTILGSFGFLTLCLVAFAFFVYSIFYCLASRELTMLSRMRRFSQCNFVLELCKLGVTIDVYDDAHTFFNHNGVSLRMTTTLDATFSQNGYPSGIKAHLRFEKTDWAGYSAKVDIFSLGLILAELWVPMTDDQAATLFDNYRCGRSSTVLSQYSEVFRTNRDIRLLGIGLYVGEGKSRAKARLYRVNDDNEKNSEEVTKIYEDDLMHDSRCILAIPFPEPALIRANEWHTISAWINGTAWDYGINGKHNVTAGGVAFDFRNSSLPDENYTTADMGQIPELYFLKAEEYEEKIKDNVYGRVAARQAQIDKKVQEYKGEIANREDQIHTMQTEIDKLKSALDMAMEKLARIELTNCDQIKTTSDTNTKVEKALADFKQSYEMKYQEQESRINDLENKSTEAAMNRNNVTGFRLRFLFDMNDGSVVNRFRETVPEQWSFELAVIFDYWASACMPVKPGAKQMANGNRWMLEKDERIGDEFKTDRDIRLVGIGVYFGNGISVSTRKILGDNEDTVEEVASSNKANIDYSDSITRFSFTNPCLIPANEWHVITLMRESIGRTRFGLDGKDRVEADGVVFDFRRSKFAHETSVKLEYGQIPEIYFELQIELGDIKLKYQQQQAELQNELGDIKLKYQQQQAELQIELGDIKLKYEQQQAEVEELKEKLIQAWLAQFPHLIFDSSTTLKFNDLEKLDKLLVTIQLENGNNIYYDNVKPFELFAMIDGKRENADLKLLEGEYDCSFKGVMGNYAYFSSARRKIVRFFKVSIADSKIQLELINELKTTDLIPFENQPLYFIEKSREWIVFHYHENYTEMEGEKFDISELQSIRKFDCHYHRGILYFFRENTPPKLERLNEKVVVVEAPVFDGQLSYYTPPHSDYIYVANTDQNILITLNTTNLHVAQHSYEPPIDSTYHSIVGVHNGILTMVFEGTVGRCLMTTKLSYIDLSP